MRGSARRCTTAAVLSVQPSPTISSSKSAHVWASTDSIANGSTSARLWVGRMMLTCGDAPRLTLPARRTFKFVGDAVRIEWQPILIRVGVIVGDGRKVDHHQIGAAQVAVG